MHKILVKTELPRLRELGFEVFNPPYRSDNNQHQSAYRGEDPDQPTTLPREVFDRLFNYDFFEKPIEPEIAELLNRYFDAVIVTIDPGWLVSVLRVFRKKVIYRTYGHVLNMSDHLWAVGAYPLVESHPDFVFVPHAEESGLQEHYWLRKRMEVVPYVVPQDVVDCRDTWSPDEKHRAEIMISCPNLENPFYLKHYRYLKRKFGDSYYRYYGVQPASVVTDEKIVGTIPFDQYLNSYRECAGFLYTYRNPTVCFLPPIEMMIAGGPVVFLSGSLLDRYFRGEAPGRASTESEADEKCRRILEGDLALIEEIRRSQASVAARYLPETVWPIFDRVFSRTLREPSEKRVVASTSRRVRAVFGFLRPPIKFENGKYTTESETLLEFRKNMDSDTQYEIDCSYRDFPFVHGFFGSAPFGKNISYRISRPIGDGFRFPRRVLGKLRSWFPDSVLNADLVSYFRVRSGRVVNLLGDAG